MKDGKIKTRSINSSFRLQEKSLVAQFVFTVEGKDKLHIISYYSEDVNRNNKCIFIYVFHCMHVGYKKP
jgi:hypothetical protein